MVGDKWSLLVVRDMLGGKQTYDDLLASPERIPTNLLAERLERLERAGLVSRSAYQDRPVRYAYVLTDKGKALARCCRALRTVGETPYPRNTHPPRGSAGGPPTLWCLRFSG